MISDHTDSPNKAQPGTKHGAPKYGERGGYGRGPYGTVKQKTPSQTTDETDEGRA